MTKTMFEVPASALVQALKVRAGEHGTTHRGTYNRQDPTAFEKIECYLYFGQDPFVLRNYKYEPTAEDLAEYPREVFDYAPPPDALYRLRVNDVTWGTEITLDFVDSSLDDDVIHRYMPQAVPTALNFYLDHNSGKILWESDLEKVQHFLLDCIRGDVEFCHDRKRFDKYMTPDELQAREAAVHGPRFLRSCI